VREHRLSAFPVEPGVRFRRRRRAGDAVKHSAKLLAFAAVLVSVIAGAPGGWAAVRVRDTAPADFYVSTAGSDANPGTVDLPFRTIQHG